MLLLDSDIFKFEKNWLLDKIYIYIYIYSLPTPSLVYSPLVFHSRIHGDLQDTLRQEDNTLELINDMGN
jgi:hypothetical protein